LQNHLSPSQQNDLIKPLSKNTKRYSMVHLEGTHIKKCI
jgi:hypothetical protein